MILNELPATYPNNYIQGVSNTKLFCSIIPGPSRLQGKKFDPFLEGKNIFNGFYKAVYIASDGSTLFVLTGNPPIPDRFEVENPYTEEIIAEVPNSSSADVGAAVSAAKSMP